MKRWEIYLEIFMEILIFGAIVLFIGLGLPKLVAFFWPIVAAAILAMITNPLKRFLEKYLKMPKKLGATLMVILLLAVVSFAIYGLIKVVKFGDGEVSQKIPGIDEDLMAR
nr:AI-2E family transporter [Lachnospiraceae bacterium]